MIGYSIRVDELELPNQENRIENFIFVDPKETEEHYPIPTAFLAYTKYLNIKLSHERLKNREDDLK